MASIRRILTLNIRCSMIKPYPMHTHCLRDFFSPLSMDLEGGTMSSVRALLWVQGCIILVVVLAVFSPGMIAAQWEADYRLTTDNETSLASYNNAWCVAAYQDTVHVVWHDDRDGNYEIYYKRSDDGGMTWGTDTRLTDEPNGSYTPSVAVTGQSIHVVWEDDRDMDTEVYHKRSTDAGVTWGSDVHVTVSTGPQGIPSVAVVGEYVHVAWVDFTLMGNSEIYYGRSTDGGLIWGTPSQISYAGGFSSSPSIAAQESDVHIAWQDTRFGWYNNEIFYRHSSDDGVTWGNESRLTEDTTFSNTPSIGVDANYVHVVWEEMRDGNFEIYYKRSTDYGQTWGQDTRLTDDTGESHSPSIAVSGSNVHIVWMENRDGNEEIYYKNSVDNGTAWSVDTRLTDDLNASQNASLAVCGEKVHVVWQDDRDGNWEIYFKRNPTGNTYVNEYQTEIVSQLNLAVSPNPFSQRTTFTVNSQSDPINGVLSIYNSAGRLVKRFSLPTAYSLVPTVVTWDGTDQADHALPSGVYLLKLKAGEHTTTRKLLLIR